MPYTMYRALCRSTGSDRALTITSGPMPAGSPIVIAIVGRYSILSPLPRVRPHSFYRRNDALNQNVRLEIEGPALCARPERGDREGHGDQRDLELVAAHGCDGQAYAVETYRAFGHDVACQLGRQLQTQTVFRAAAAPVLRRGIE